MEIDTDKIDEVLNPGPLQMERTMPDRRVLALLVMALLLSFQMSEARTVKMIESNPKAETIIHGDHAEFVVRFNGPVDHHASRLEIVQNGRVVHTFLPLENAAADVLYAAGPVPAPGHYDLRWIAIAGDGEQSDGQISFTVQR